MIPVFNDYINFITESATKNQADDTKIAKEIHKLKEGCFWMDRQIIKGFDKAGKVHKFLKINVSSELEVTIVKPNSEYSNIDEVELMSWQDMVEQNKEHLEIMEEKALSLIKEKTDKFKDYESLVPTSTGKDSTITLYLVRQIIPNAKAIFNNTTLDCFDTYNLVKQIENCEIMNPEEGFYQYRKRANIIPNRFSRFCCRIFKTGEMVKRLDHSKKYLMWMGMRNDESSTRAGYEDEWINEKEWGKTNWQGILPIRHWTEMDVWLYMLYRNLPINPKYKKGYIRVGCSIACPYYEKGTYVLDRFFYPDMRSRWEKILEDDFISNNKWIVLNCTVDEYINIGWSGGVFRAEPTEEVISEFADYNKIDIDIARTYFNKYCYLCENEGKKKKIKDKEVLSMNIKLLGRSASSSRVLCKKCLMNKFELTDEIWADNINNFKANGCSLF